MEEQTILDAYKLIEKMIYNKNGTNGGIANELVRKHVVLDRQDLVHSVVIKFIERNHKEPIINLSKYVNIFTFKELMNLKRYYTYRENIESIDDYIKNKPELFEYFK